MTENTSVAKKKGFKMLDIYIVLACFILVMAALTYIVPAGNYDRQMMETAHGMQNLVVAGTYKEVPSSPTTLMDLITAVPAGLERASGIVFLTFMVGACMGLIKRAGLIDLGVQRLSKAVGTSDYLVAPILMVVLSLVAAFIGVPELSLAYLPVFLPLFYRLGYDGMTATAVALLGPCLGFTRYHDSGFRRYGSSECSDPEVLWFRFPCWRLDARHRCAYRLCDDVRCSR